MGFEELCLTWDDHHKTLIGVFEALLESSTLVDCTIAAEGQYLKAHKVVLSACSPYFEMLFTQENEKNPIVVLKDIRFQDLKALIDFIYRGKVQIPEDRLGDFTDAAESLQIKGLGGGHRKNNSEKKHRETPNIPKKDGHVSPIARKRLRNSFPVTEKNSVKAAPLSPTSAGKNPRYENTPQIQNTDCVQPVLPSAASDPSSVKVHKEPSEVRSSSSVARSSVPINESDLEPMTEIFLPESLVEPKSEVCMDDTTLIGSEDTEDDATLEEGADYEESGNSDFSSTHGLLKQESSNSFLIEPVAECSSTGTEEPAASGKVRWGGQQPVQRLSAADATAQDENAIQTARDCPSTLTPDVGITWNTDTIAEPFGETAEWSRAIAMRFVTPTFPPPLLPFPRRSAEVEELLEAEMANRHRLHCSWCERTFANTASLRVHERKHTGERPFKCAHCAKAFHTAWSQQVHTRIHTGEMPFHCQYCQQRFTASSGLYYHMRKKHKDLLNGDGVAQPNCGAAGGS